MTTLKEQQNQYYFVPLGRDRDGYLALLSLPPTASIGEAKKAEVQYKKSIERDFKIKRGELRSKLKDNNITQEEFDAQVKEWEDQKTQKNVELNKLNESFKKAQAEKRKLHNKGIKDTNVVWLEMYKEYDRENFFKEWRSGKKPLRTIDQRQLNSLKSFWLNSGLEKKRTFSDTSLQVFSGGNQQPSMSNFHELLDEKKMVCLLWADAIWSKLKYTNREFWQKKVETWEDELICSRPRFNLTATEGCSDMAPLFSSLCSLSDLAIDHLITENIEDCAQIPERRGDQEQLDLRKLLAMAFEKKLIQESDSGPGGERKLEGGTPAEGDFFERFMELLSTGLAAKD